MDASRDGIQKLMTAEKEAQAIVSAAREGACAMATRMWHRRGCGVGARARVGTDECVFDACVSLAEKTARLRQAVEEAKGEIAAYRAMREETYSKMLREVRARATRRISRRSGRRRTRMTDWVDGFYT
jgi:hypothetical protein